MAAVISHFLLLQSWERSRREDSMSHKSFHSCAWMVRFSRSFSTSNSFAKTSRLCVQSEESAHTCSPHTTPVPSRNIRCSIFCCCCFCFLLQSHPLGGVFIHTNLYSNQELNSTIPGPVIWANKMAHSVIRQAVPHTHRIAPRGYEE